MAKKFIIEGGRYLKGEIRIRGAKNAVTKQMVASLLAPGRSVLQNVPEIGDVEITKRILASIGCSVDHDQEGGVLSLDAAGLATHRVPEEYSGLNRIPILLAGVLLHRFGTAEIPMMGGCDIGPRPVDFHLEGLRSLGADVRYEKGVYRFSAKRLTGARITLP